MAFFPPQFAHNERVIKKMEMEKMIQRRRDCGIALLMVVLVLAMLTIIGVLFSLTVSVHLKTNIQYREFAEVENAGQAAMHRFMSELMYNVWGTDETRAFTCADGTPLGVPYGTAVGDFSCGTYAGPTDDPDSPIAAYTKSRWDDSTGEADPKPIMRPWSRFVQSVVTLEYGTHTYEAADPIDGSIVNDGKLFPNPRNDVFKNLNGAENDYRWMVSADVWGSKEVGVIAERLLDARTENSTTQANPRAVVSGGLYHDEFLPTGLSNADCWEAAAHYNHGTIFGRSWCYSSGEKPTSNHPGPLYTALSGYNAAYELETPNPGHNASYWARARVAGGGRALYWWGDIGGGLGVAGWNGNLFFPDYFNTRIVGNSFYRIFRFDLIDPQDFKVRGTGVNPDKPGRYYSDAEIYGISQYAKEGSGQRINRATHLGDASYVMGNTNPNRHTYIDHSRAALNEPFTDELGGALNINQVNMNYQLEHYRKQETTNYLEQAELCHYNESKWIYLYDDKDSEQSAWARYALHVWPDSGLPNVNFLPSFKNALGKPTTGGSGMFTQRYDLWQMFATLDVGPGESGLSSIRTVRTRSQGTVEADGTFGVYLSNGNVANVMGKLAFGNVKALPSAAEDQWTKYAEAGQDSGGRTYGQMYARMMAWLDWHRRRNGTYASRAEVETVLRKFILCEKDAALELRRTNTINSGAQTMLGEYPLSALSLNSPSAAQMRLHDATLLANYFSANSYEYLLDPHWEQDRLVFDGQSYSDWLLAANAPPSGSPDPWKRLSNSMSPVLGGGYCDVTENPAAACVTRRRLGDILGGMKDYHGIRSVPTGADESAQPAQPLLPFFDNYAKISKYSPSYVFVGPKHAERAKAHFLSQLLNSTYAAHSNWSNYTWPKLTRFAVDAADPAGTPAVNITPRNLLFPEDRNKDYVTDRIWGPRITEVGCGVFTVPAGPKFLDADYEDDDHKRLYISHVDQDQNPDSKDWNTSVKHDLSPILNANQPNPDFDHRYPFETKSMNFIELTTTVLSWQMANWGEKWFLRVYGNVRNWDGKIYEEDFNGDGVPDEILDDPKPASAGNNYSGGTGYVDLFARVRRVADGFEADGVTPRYKVEMPTGWSKNADGLWIGTNGDGAVVSGWAGSVYYDPYHYIEGVVIRYFGSPTRGDRDRANDLGWFGGYSGGVKFGDTNGDNMWSNDRDWRAENDGTGKLLSADDKFMKPRIVKGQSTEDVLYVPDPDKQDDSVNGKYYGKYYDRRAGANKNLLNPDGVVGDNIPDEDWGTPKTSWDKNNGSLDQDQKIDGLGGWYDQSDVTWWKQSKETGAFFEDLADWINSGKYRLHENVESKEIDDTYSSRSWSNVSLSMQGSSSALSYRFGSYTLFPVIKYYDNSNFWVSEAADYGGNAHLLRAEPPIGSPDYGLTHNLTVEAHPWSYLLVMFPHARTPWTRRTKEVLVEARGLTDEETKKRFGIGHYDDNAAYPNVSEATPRRSNYADGDSVVLGLFYEDGFKRYALSQSKAQYMNQPRVVTYVKLNGKNPDFSEAGGAAGPAARFERQNATISGGTFIVNADGTINRTDCSETLPGGKSQSFPSETGRGFSTRDVRDNLAAWKWDATCWDWSGDRQPDVNLDAPHTFNRQSPAFTAYDSRFCGWESNALKKDTDDLGRGRFDRHVHGRNANTVYTQMDHADPRAANPALPQALRLMPDYFDCDFDGQADVSSANSAGTGKAGGKGRFPYPIFTHTAARPSGSSAALVLNGRMTTLMNDGGERHCAHFNDRIWMRHVALGSGDMRMRSWWDLCMRARADELFESDCQNPILGLLNPAYSPIRDFEDNNMLGVSEKFTTKSLWRKGNPLGDGQGGPYGRYFLDRKTVKRINLNEISTCMQVSGLIGSFFRTYGNLDTEASGTFAPISLISQKPLRGYAYINGWDQRIVRRDSYRNAAFWSDNLWADSSADLSSEQPNKPDEAGWAAQATVAPSPVYTAFVLAQRLGADGQPLAEEKLRVTVERTWDGKMNVLEYRVTPGE